MGVPTDISEFSYLPAQAQAIDAPLPPATREHVVLSDGRTLSALRFGESTPEVVLLHGAGLNAHTWDTTILHLGRAALAIDLAGHGDSSWRPDAAYAPRALAADVAEALTQWELGPVLVVGQSLGGLTAAALAASRPELVDGVIIVDITPGIDTSAGPAALREFYRVSDFASRDELVERAMSFGLGGSRADTERGVFFNSRVREDGRVEWKHHFAHLAAQVFAAPEHDGTPAAGAVLDDTGWDDLAAVRTSLTLVRGTRGFVSEDDAAEYLRRLPAARIVSFDATHNVQETAPAALADLIRERIDHGM
ncbi:alpha/beta fold hydrolase [Microbacterium sp. NPDC055903]